MDRTDEDCVHLCLNGQREVFRELVLRYQGRLVSYLTAQLDDTEAAEEAAQEAFVRAYFRLRKLKKSGSFFPWLVGISKRIAKETCRAEQRRRQAIARHHEASRQEDDDDPGNEAVLSAVAALPELCREVVLLRYYAGLSCVGVSRKLGVPVGTVTSRLSRAYVLLRKSLREQQ